jgi:L-arabinonolactonase
MIETEIDLTDLLHGTSLPPNDDSDFVTAVLVLDCHNLLGEGILFDDRKHTVMWPDILSSKFHTVLLNYKEPTKVVHTVYDLPKKLCSFGLLEEESTTAADNAGLPLLCAWEDGFQLYDIAKQTALSEMSVGEDVNPSKGTTRLNDGRVDPAGQRYICGGFNGHTPGIRMNVYKVEQETSTSSSSGKLVHEPIVTGIEVANSICWSLDGKTMYLADSPTKQIHSYDYSTETGTVSGKKLLHSKPANEKGVPDGSCVDAEGYLWNAVWKSGQAASCVQRIDPVSGLVVFTVHMPDTTSQVTCCCFGGEKMDILFITTAMESRDAAKEPHAGGLYAARLPFQGRKESRLKFAIVPSTASTGTTATSTMHSR